MSFNRKFKQNFKRKNPKMRKLIFPAESYTLTPVKDKDGKEYLKCDDALIGRLELFWSGIENSPCSDLTKKEHKINKRLKESLRTVTRYKDDDEDARVALEGPQHLILEEDQYDLAKKLLEANKFYPKVSDVLSELWDIIDNAETFTPLKAVPADDSK